MRLNETHRHLEKDISGYLESLGIMFSPQLTQIVVSFTISSHFNVEMLHIMPFKCSFCIRWRWIWSS